MEKTTRRFVSRSQLAEEYSICTRTLAKYLQRLEGHIDLEKKRLFAPFEVKIIRAYLENGELPDQEQFPQ